MNAAALNRRLLPAVAALALLVTILGAFFALKGAAAAWLFAVFVALGLSTGAITLLLTGRLTGGAWIAALAPVLVPMACLVPLVGIAFIPLFLLMPQLYPWAAEGAHHASVGAYYLNMPLLLLRWIVAFAGWSALAVWCAGGRGGQIVAGLGLVFNIVMTTMLTYDWILALQPSFTSSVFGAYTAIQFLLSALALALVIAPPEGKALRDGAGLLIAGILGVVYIGFMQFLIIWYGNLSETAKFYLDRAGPAGTTTLLAALIVGGLAPLVLLLPAEGRGSRARVRAAAALVLAGIGLYWAWCVCALMGAAAALLAPFALVGMLAALAMAAPYVETRLKWRAA